MKYKCFFFAFLDDGDTKNKKMDANTEKRKGKLNKNKTNRMILPCFGA